MEVDARSIKFFCDESPAAANELINIYIYSTAAEVVTLHVKG